MINLAPEINKNCNVKRMWQKIVLLHPDSNVCERRNQLALIEGQLFVNLALDANTEEMKVKLNVQNQIR